MSPKAAGFLGEWQIQPPENFHANCFFFFGFKICFFVGKTNWQLLLHASGVDGLCEVGCTFFLREINNCPHNVRLWGPCVYWSEMHQREDSQVFRISERKGYIVEFFY